MNVAIIVAAGRGTRMNDPAGLLKQFRLLAGVPLLIHTLRRFEQAASVNSIIVVVPAESRTEFLQLMERFNIAKLSRVVAGGKTRLLSVQRGLAEVDSVTTSIVLVHDGARPFVSPTEIDACVRAAEETGSAILAVPVTDTIKEVQGEIIIRTHTRAALRHALTPQCFRYTLLREAYAAAARDRVNDATDDSQLVERLGYPVRVLDADPRNIKLTRPEDWAIAERMLEEVS